MITLKPWNFCYELEARGALASFSITLLKNPVKKVLYTYCERIALIIFKHAHRAPETEVTNDSSQGGSCQLKPWIIVIANLAFRKFCCCFLNISLVPLLSPIGNKIENKNDKCYLQFQQNRNLIRVSCFHYSPSILFLQVPICTSPKCFQHFGKLNCVVDHDAE